MSNSEAVLHKNSDCCACCDQPIRAGSHTKQELCLECSKRFEAAGLPVIVNDLAKWMLDHLDKRAVLDGLGWKRCCYDPTIDRIYMRMTTPDDYTPDALITTMGDCDSVVIKRVVNGWMINDSFYWTLSGVVAWAVNWIRTDQQMNDLLTFLVDNEEEIKLERIH